MSRRRAVTLVALITTVAATLAVGSADAHPSYAKRVDYLGDSYTHGTALGGRGRYGYPEIIGRKLDWSHRLHAVNGTGYVNPARRAAHQRGTFATRVNAVISDDPDIVVVLGSRNDMGRATLGVERAAAIQVLGTLHRRLPRAEVIAVGPPWIDATPPPGLLLVRNAVEQAAHDVGVPFIDPIAEGWFAAPGDSRLIARDHIHPNDAGQAYMAARLVTDFRRMGLV
jgi:lysophospholipase L1-like esterase